VNTDPYAAWLFRMTLADTAQLAALLDAADYEKGLA
jgi:glycine cleavage system H lipoate-binding protein